MSKKPQQSEPGAFSRYSGMVIKMAVIIYAATWSGLKLDERWNNEVPWATLAFSLVGVSMAIYIIIRDTTPPS